VYFAYFHESGDAGYDNSPSQAFALTTGFVHEREWLRTLDELVGFRRYLRDQFGISPRVELKAYWLIQRKGPSKNSPLSYQARMNIYRAALRFHRKCGTTRTFAVVISKQRVQMQSVDACERAWTFAIQRLERFGTVEEQNRRTLICARSALWGVAR
jgi:hypothetical protein